MIESSSVVALSLEISLAFQLIICCIVLIGKSETGCSPFPSKLGSLGRCAQSLSEPAVHVFCVWPSSTQELLESSSTCLLPTSQISGPYYASQQHMKGMVIVEVISAPAK